MSQAAKQVQASNGRPIEWHFAEKPVADYFRQQFSNEGWANITVIHAPYRGGEQ